MEEYFGAVGKCSRECCSCGGHGPLARVCPQRWQHGLRQGPQGQGILAERQGQGGGYGHEPVKGARTSPQCGGGTGAKAFRFQGTCGTCAYPSLARADAVEQQVVHAETVVSVTSGAHEAHSFGTEWGIAHIECHNHYQPLEHDRRAGGPGFRGRMGLSVGAEVAASMRMCRFAWCVLGKAEAREAGQSAELRRAACVGIPFRSLGVGGEIRSEFRGGWGGGGGNQPTDVARSTHLSVFGAAST